MTLRGAKIPKRLQPLLEDLAKQQEIFLGQIDSSTRRQLYEMQEQGIIDLEMGAKIRLNKGAVHINKKHQRLMLFSLGFLVVTYTNFLAFSTLILDAA